jgi:hypothetical protein
MMEADKPSIVTASELTTNHVQKPCFVEGSFLRKVFSQPNPKKNF